jgi:hypothetical protein
MSPRLQQLAEAVNHYINGNYDKILDDLNGTNKFEEEDCEI